VAFAYLLTSAATICYVLVAPFLASLAGWHASPLALLLQAIAVLAASAVVNIVGVRLFSRINSVAVLAEVVAALVIAVAVAIAYAIKPDHPVTILLRPRPTCPKSPRPAGRDGLRDRSPGLPAGRLHPGRLGRHAQVGGP
jgi:amino acid transporter